MSAMTSQQIMQDSHVTRMRALKDENARLREELARACEERDSLRQHVALALLAARDAERLLADGTLLIVDGWNAILGSENVRDKSDTGWREQLKNIVAKRLEKCPDDIAWIVFDGHEVNGSTEGRLRISYTGGAGAHRADRMVCDYLRMRKILGLSHPVTVVTDDKDFAKEAAALGAAVKGTDTLNAQTQAN